MFDKVDIDRVKSDRCYRNRLKRRGEIQMFWFLNIFVPGMITLFVFTPVKEVMSTVFIVFGIMAMMSCVILNGLKPLAIFPAIGRMWIAGLRHVRGLD